MKPILDTKYFPLPLDIRWIGSDLFQLRAPFEYLRNNGEVIRAEKGAITDFGSKPFWVLSFIGSPTDEGGPGYVLHDEMRKNATWPYSKTDRIFLEMLRDLKMAYLKRMVIYLAVRTQAFFLSPSEKPS